MGCVSRQITATSLDSSEGKNVHEILMSICRTLGFDYSKCLYYNTVYFVSVQDGGKEKPGCSWKENLLKLKFNMPE